MEDIIIFTIAEIIELISLRWTLICRPRYFV